MTVKFYRVQKDGSQTLVSYPRAPENFHNAPGGFRYWVPIKCPGVIRYNVLDRIYQLLPKGHKYIEVFGGSGKFIAYLKRPGLRIYNDLNPWMSFSFARLQTTPHQRLNKIANFRPNGVSDEEFENLRQKILQETPRTLGDMLDFFMFNTLSYRGRYDGRRGGYQPNSRGPWKQWLDFRRHIKGVETWNRDALDVIREANSRTVLFLDPPYPAKNAGYRNYVNLKHLRDALAETRGGPTR